MSKNQQSEGRAPPSPETQAVLAMRRNWARAFGAPSAGRDGADARDAMEVFEAAMTLQRAAARRPSRLIDLERRAQFGRFGFSAV